MSLLQSLIFGIVEGITEFLPVSSTGHLILTARLLGLTSTDFLTSFEVTIQVGAILAVIYLYGRTLVLDAKILKRVAAAFVPTAVIGFILYKFIKKYLLGNDKVVLWALLAGGIFIILFEVLYKEKAEDTGEVKNITYKQAFFIGIFQALAVVPGVSRAAATIIGGLSLGLKRKTIVEFSFLLAVPTMLAAAGYDLLETAPSFSFSQVYFLMTGFVSSFLVALVGIKFLLSYVKKYNFIAFGVYRIVIASIFLFF